MRAVAHAITPGDHFSPRTGSAIPTVVDGLAAASRAAGDGEQSVLVARGTYPDRYDSARIVEYDQRPDRTRARQLADLAAGRAVQVRPFARHALRPLVAEQRRWPAGVVLCHNLVELVGVVDADRHVPVLYAHNELLRTYSRREGGRALGRAGAIVCVSDDLAERTRDRLPPGLRERVVTVHNGVDTDRFRPSPGRSTERGRDGLLRIAFVGRVVPEKGADVLLQALALLDRSDLVVSVLGSAGFDPHARPTPYEQRLRELAAHSRAKVEFEPFVARDRLAALLGEHDALVVPSRWAEPSTLTVPEGQACGLAVVASRVGGIPEVTAVPELLVPPDDPAALAAMLAALADDRSRLAEAAHRSRAYAEEHDWRHTWRALRAALAPLL